MQGLQRGVRLEWYESAFSFAEIVEGSATRIAAQRVAERISHLTKLHNTSHRHIRTSKRLNEEIARCGMELNFDSQELWPLRGVNFDVTRR